MDYLIIMQGVVLPNIEYDLIFNLSEDIAAVNKKKSLVSVISQIIIPLIYEFACSFSHGLASVKSKVCSQ